MFLFLVYDIDSKLNLKSDANRLTEYRPELNLEVM